MPSLALLSRRSIGLAALCLLGAWGQGVEAAEPSRQAIEAALRRGARPAAMLMRQPASNTAPAESWLGGLPRMPDDLAWPTYAASGEPMSFLAQIDLSDVPPRARTGQGAALPAKGVLWVFAVLDDSTETPDKVRVLYRPLADPTWKIRAAPAGLPMLQHGAPYDWLAEGNPLRSIDLRQPIRMAALDTYAESAEALPFEIDDYDAFSDTLGALRDAAIARAIKPTSGPAAFSPERYGPLEAWPQTGLFAELAAGLAVDATPGAYIPTTWSPATVAAFRALHDEAEARRKDAAARPFVPLTTEERRAFRDWLTDFDRRLKAVGAGLEKPWRPYPDTALDSVRNETLPFAARHVRARDDAALGALLPAAYRPAQPVLSYASDEQILGHGQSWQSAPLEHRNDVLLLQLGNGHCEWLPVGVFLHLWISPADLAARRFDRVQPTLESD